MIKNLIETIMVFVLLVFVPSFIMMMHGVIGPFMVLIGLMFIEFGLLKYNEKKERD